MKTRKKVKNSIYSSFRVLNIFYCERPRLLLERPLIFGAGYGLVAHIQLFNSIVRCTMYDALNWCIKLPQMKTTVWLNKRMRWTNKQKIAKKYFYVFSWKIFMNILNEWIKVASLALCNAMQPSQSNGENAYVRICFNHFE